MTYKKVFDLPLILINLFCVPAPLLSDGMLQYILCFFTDGQLIAIKLIMKILSYQVSTT